MHSAPAVDLIHGMLSDGPNPSPWWVTGPQTNVAGLQTGGPAWGRQPLRNHPPYAGALRELRSIADDQIWGLPDAPSHDPVAVACVLDPSLVEGIQAPSRSNRMANSPWRDRDGPLRCHGEDPNALVATHLDSERFRACS